MSDKDTASFIKGKEFDSSNRPSAWTAYLNVCGSTSSIGCTDSSPVCQNSGETPSKYVSMGASSTWKMEAYYDPTDPNKKPQPDQGLFVTIGNGTTCGSAPNTVARTSYLWLQCDPTVTERPTQVKITESDPATQTATPCHYYFAPIRHRMFCPSVSNQTQVKLLKKLMQIL